MKRLSCILLLLLPLAVAAQNVPSIDDLFARYADREGFTSVQLEPKMMQLMSRQAAERGDRGLATLLDKIQYIRIVALKTGDGGQFIEDAEATVAANPRFELVSSSTENGQTTRFYLYETPYSYNGKSELVMITYGPKETVAVNIYGAFDLQQIARLSAIRPKLRKSALRTERRFS